MEKAVGKNMVAQHMRLVAEHIDSMDLDIQDKHTKLVLSEYINILSKSSIAMLSEDEDEIKSCKDDMMSSIDVISDMAKLTNNQLAKELTDGYLKEWIEEHELFQIREDILDYVDIVNVIVRSWEGVIPA